MTALSKIDTIKALTRTAVTAYANGFQARHLSEVSDPQGTINMKIHNVFISVLGPEIQYYTALVRSLDSSLGNMLEALAIEIAKLSFVVKRNVEGPLSNEQTQIIATLLEQYKSHQKIPNVLDYQSLRIKPKNTDLPFKRHDSDYYLINQEDNSHFLIELKIGGDLDNKKARSEKEAILEQFAILSNTLPESTSIKIYFATGYNRYGEGQPWEQQRVKQFFASEELLIGSNFWNFVSQLNNGYDIVLEEYCNNASLIKDALANIKSAYLP